MDEATLRLTFPEAIAYLRNKVPFPSTSWKTYSGQLQDVAFTVAGITKATLLADIQALVIKQLETGVTLEGFQRDFSDLLDKTGHNLGNRGYRTELIIQQNVRTAYSRGRWEQMKKTRDRRPYGLWRHADSRVPRPHHLAQDGKVYPLDADAFKAIQPPPFGCRCKVFALSDADLERMGLAVSEPPPLNTISEPGFDQGFAELPKERDRLLKEAKKRIPQAFLDQLDFADADTAFAEAIEAALNGTLDFATPMFGKGARAGGKKPNCTAGKSHFCQTPNGRGSCVPLSKKCKYEPQGVVKEAADWEGEKVKSTPSSVLDWEDRHRLDEIESAGIFDQSGMLIFEKSGTEDAVDYDAAELSKIKGQILTHNHPLPKEWGDISKVGLGFSTQDIKLAFWHEVQEMRIVSGGFRFSIKPPAKGWNADLFRKNGAAYQKIYDDQLVKSRNKRDRALAQGKTQDEARKILNHDFHHAVAVRFAKKLGFSYTREKI